MFRKWGWYKSGLGICIAVFLGLCSVIFIDIIPQSFRTGQFWNAIIVVSGLVFAIIICLVIFLVRFSRTRVWIHHIPRDYTISRRDTPGRMMNIVDNCSRDCREKFEKQIKLISANHPGLQPPSKGDEPLELPYAAIVEILPLFLEDNITAFHSQFVRKRSFTLRQYLYNAIRFSILLESDEPLIEDFLQNYERTRFGNSILTEEEFYNLFTQAILVVRCIRIPGSESAPQTSAILDDDVGSTSSDICSVIIHDKTHTSSFLQVISRQPSFSTALRNSSSELSLPEMVQRYRTASTRSSRPSVSLRPSTIGLDSSSLQMPDIIVTRTETGASEVSEQSTHTFVHHIQSS